MGRVVTKVLAQEQYEVQVALNPERALQCLAEKYYHVILIDLSHIGGKGLKWLCQLKRKQQRVEILVLIEYVIADTVVEAMKLGAYGVISKPCMPKKILAEIGKVFKKITCQKYEDALVSFIQEHTNTITSREYIAEYFNISSKTVTNRVRKVTRKSFIEFLEFCRIDESKRLLEYTGLSSSQIAYQVGFNSPQSFCRSFRKLTSVTPTQYRLENRGLKNNGVE